MEQASTVMDAALCERVGMVEEQAGVEVSAATAAVEVGTPSKPAVDP